MPRITYAEERILNHLYRMKARGYLSSCSIADFVGYAQRTARHYLRYLEQRGMVERSTPKGGWRINPTYTHVNRS